MASNFENFNSENLFTALTERQRIALSGKWAGLKDFERDAYAEYAALGLDSAMLYCIHTLTVEADARIFSENRPIYLASMLQWHSSLVSSEDTIRKFAEEQLGKLRDETNSAQQSTLLSAVKARLLEKRTFLPEGVEKSYRALCRFFGFDANMVK